MSGQAGSIRSLLAAFLAGGHVLLEDNPGTGKESDGESARAHDGATTAASNSHDCCRSTTRGAVFNRATIVHFHAGPIFTQILLADEVNRASPRTQSACSRRWPSGR